METYLVLDIGLFFSKDTRKQEEDPIVHVPESHGRLNSFVIAMVKNWRNMNPDGKIYVFSSGMVQAKKLLFEMANLGKVLRYVDGHFDIDDDWEPGFNTYKKIAHKIGVQTNAIVYMTDDDTEAIDAIRAGMKSLVLEQLLRRKFSEEQEEENENEIRREPEPEHDGETTDTSSETE